MGWGVLCLVWNSDHVDKIFSYLHWNWFNSVCVNNDLLKLLFTNWLIPMLPLNTNLSCQNNCSHDVSSEWTLIKIKYSIYDWGAMKESFLLRSWNLANKDLLTLSPTQKVSHLGFWISFLSFVKPNIEYISLLEVYLSICAHSLSWGK